MVFGRIKYQLSRSGFLETSGIWMEVKSLTFFYTFPGQMRSLRLFYNDTACTQGQIVIASRESQYKILHFHNGGLDKLAEIFDDWSLFAQETDEVKSNFFIII